jgi:hypothetical protein
MSDSTSTSSSSPIPAGNGKTEKNIVIALVVLALVIIVIYSAVILYAWTQDSLLFAPYEPPPPPSGTYQPRVSIRDLSSEEATRQACLYQNFLNNDKTATCPSS